MTLKTLAYLTSYLFLSLITTALVGYTIYEGSLHVTYGRRVSDLKIERGQLLAEERDVSQALATEQSIASIDSFGQAQGFEPISNLKILTAESTIVAQR